MAQLPLPTKGERNRMSHKKSSAQALTPSNFHRDATCGIIGHCTTLYSFQCLYRTTTVMHYQRPIQLLLPPGLCSPVWPIFTIDVAPGRSWSPDVLILGGEGGMSMASTTGLNALLQDALADRSDSEGDGLLIAIEPRRDGAKGTSSARGTGRKASADHSYQTCRVLVSRHRDTVTSELFGR
jgi:hypothetical protein